MNFNIIARASRIAAIGAILLGSASCVDIDENLGENFIPTDQKWDVHLPEAAVLQDIRMQMADSLSGYSTTRFVFGAVNDATLGTSVKSTTFTLVPLLSELDFGENTKVRRFEFTAVRDTVSTVHDNQEKILQNVYVSELKQALDSTVLYAGSFSEYTESGRANREKYLDPKNVITEGIPVYNGGDSLSFYFSEDFAYRFIDRLKETQLDSMNSYVSQFPGIYITTDVPASEGGRINMFDLPIETSSGYVTGNYALLSFTAEYDKVPVDTSFIFYFGPAEFIDDEDTSYPTQFAFNASDHAIPDGYDAKEGLKATDKILVAGGAGLKPVIKAEEIKEIVEEQIAQAGIVDFSEVVINKATIILPYEVSDYAVLDKYPMILSPTVRLRSSEGDYVSYAGLTDSSIESENQGDINRSLSLYSPDISHHVQEILKLDRNSEDYSSKISSYDIWFLIMHEEVTQTSTDNSYNDYYNNLLYNSYYNNMMYDPYGYGYGYGGYGYGYGGYGYGGYGYNNYYNYYMMAAYASASSSTTTSSSVELDKDRYYNAVLNGPEYGNTLEQKPRLKITFSAPKSSERR